MKSTEYWRRRALKDKAASLADAQRLIREMRALFADTQAHMAATIEQILTSMGGDLAAARSIISAPELQSLRRKYGRLRDIAASGRDNGLAGKLLSDMYKGGRVNRLDAMLEQIDYYAAQLNGDGVGIVRKNLLNSAAGAYYHKMYDFEQYAGRTLNWSRLDSGKLEQLLRYNWSGKHWEDRFGGHVVDFAEKVKSAIGRGVLTGGSVADVTRELTKLTNIERYNAERIARTETAYIAERANAMAYGELGVTHYGYLAELDLKTSHKCAALHGQVFALKDAVMGENYPPVHPNCRSTTVPELDADDPQMRAADGGASEIPADMKFNDWYGQRVKGRGKGDNAFKDAFGEDAAKVLYPELKPKARNAMIEAHNDVLNHGLLTGREKGIVLDGRTGKRLGESTGDKHSVEMEALISAKTKQIIFVHNHPSSETVSFGDIVNMIQNPIIDTTAVQAHNGTSYALRIGNGQRILGAAEDIERKLTEEYQHIRQSVDTKNMTQIDKRNYIIEEMANRYGWDYRRYDP